MGKVYINGKAYDSLTGLKLDSPAKSDDSITLRTEGNTPDPKASPRIESPKQRRIPKQQPTLRGVGFLNTEQLRAGPERIRFQFT